MQNTTLALSNLTFLGTITAPVGLSVFTDKFIGAGSMDDHLNQVIKVITPETRKHDNYTVYSVYGKEVKKNGPTDRSIELYIVREGENYESPKASLITTLVKIGTNWGLMQSAHVLELLLIHNSIDFIIEIVEKRMK